MMDNFTKYSVIMIEQSNESAINLISQMCP